MIWTRAIWSTTMFLAFLAVFQLLMAVLCDNKLTIHDVNEFLVFSSNVNSGTNFIGTTVYLDSDIDFTDSLSEQFEVIGKYPNYFRGTLDGQGHVVRNLAINASFSYQHVGLFGYSTGTTIQNVVIDETCSFTNNFIYEGYDACVGGIIGACDASDGSCILENNVNIASVTFNGNTTIYSSVGGIAGALFLISNNQGTIKNCANYGSVADVGTSAESRLGGIIGSSQGSLLSTFIFNVYVQNCANYGTVFYNGTSNIIFVGDISGYSRCSTIENCVSSGPVIFASLSTRTKYIGSIVGYASSAIITHCYWNMSIGYNAYGYEDYTSIADSHSFDSSSFELAGSVSIGNYTGTSLIGALNGAADYYILRDYSHWALNKDSRDVSFTVNKAKLSFTTNTQIILLPDLAGGGNMTFSGWYTDSACTVPLTNFTIGSDKEEDLYGLLAVDENNYTINFDTRGGSALSSITSPYGSTVELPTSITRSGCKFLNWENKYGDPVSNSFAVTSRNITLYAVWLCEHITTAREFVAFSDAVNSGTNFFGATVYLDSDIDFTDELSKQFKVINYFRGTFDGQGHAVRNLRFASPNLAVGLFGYLTGATIQNVVIDETCGIVNDNVVNGSMYTGSIIGCCYASDGPCTLKNNVNMASVTFNGNTGQVANIGGIAGGLSLTSNNKATIKNCANYGAVADVGTSAESRLGGVIGSPRISSSSTSISYAYVQNCANYGTILYNGTPNIIVIGGISGLSIYSVIENCVSSGFISVSTITRRVLIGSIVGYASSPTTITHCYWTLDVGYNIITGFSYGPIAVTGTIYAEHLSTTTLDELNAYVTSDTGFSQWAMLHLNGGSVNNLTQSDLVVAQEHFPSPVKEGNTFLRWCKDLECGEVYDNDLTGVTALYAVWKTVRVTFTFWNGTTAGPVCVEYGTAYGALPEAGTVVEGHTFYWFISSDDGDGDDDERVVTSDTIVTISSDHTLHGRWVANNYTVTLDLGNGTVITKTLQYNEAIELPQGIAREGCTHTGWDNNITIPMPAKSITINALWNCTHNSHSSSSDEPTSRDDKSKYSSNAGAIVGGVVGGLVGVILIVLAVLLFILFRKKDDTKVEQVEMTRKSRVVEKSFKSSGCTTKNYTSTSLILAESLKELYPETYRVPTITEALRTAGVDEDKIKDIVDACTLAGKSAAKEGKLSNGFSKEDAMGVALYTFDFGRSCYETNPYRIINRALISSDTNREDLQKASGLLYLVMSALRRLPRHTGETLYRGVRDCVDIGMYVEGSTVVWHGLSSTSPDMGAVKSFLASNTASRKAEGTLFIIDNGWGYDIQPYSLFPEEAEILLEPERCFKVQNVIEAELTIINLQMVETPLILPEIFGENV